MDVLIKIRGQVAMDLGSVAPIESERSRGLNLHSRDLGSVSAGYSVRPVTAVIKIKHAGLNLTGRRKENL